MTSLVTRYSYENIMKLDLAVISGKLTDVRLVIEWHHPELLSTSLESATLYAASKGFLEILLYLQEIGAHMKNKVEHIDEAAMGGHVHIIDYLLHSSENFYWDNQTLFNTIRYGHLSVLKFLLGKQERCKQIRSPNLFLLGTAAYYGKIDIFKYLISVGEDPLAHDNYCIRMASCLHHFEIVKLLVDLGVDRSLVTHQRCLKYLAFCDKMRAKIRERAQKKIYFWWIPICYSLENDIGKRMALLNWQKTVKLMEE